MLVAIFTLVLCLCLFPKAKNRLLCSARWSNFAIANSTWGHETMDEWDFSVVAHSQCISSCKAKDCRILYSLVVERFSVSITSREFQLNYIFSVGRKQHIYRVCNFGKSVSKIPISNDMISIKSQGR